ncbi:MAG: hypothetical protein RL477_810 [Pseudomonadota bacterium]|jgi:LPS-assembly lipoprotein
MWWPEAGRAVVVAAICLSLAACGFQPLYGRNQASVTGADLDTIQLPVIPDREGQLLRNYLQEAFNPDGRRRETVYRLDVYLQRSNQNLGVRRDGTATRINLTLSATVILRTVADNKEVFRSNALSVVSYNNLEARFATVAAEQDAVRRAAQSLATSIATRISVFLKNHKAKA